MDSSVQTGQRSINSRDRFVAFAFAASDAVFEVDPWGQIIFAGGATQWLLGEAEEALGGTSILDHVSKDERALLKAVMNQARIIGRANATVVHFGTNGQRPKAVTVYSSFLPEYPQSIFLTVQAGRPHIMPSELEDASRDEETGLLDVDSFARIATELAVTQPEACANLFMTLFELDGFSSIQADLDDDESQEFVEHVVSYLQALSLNGSVAARVDEEKFGVIHEGNLSGDAVRAGLTELPHADKMEVRSADLTLDASGMSEKDLAKALAYTIKEFAENNEDFTLTSLAGAYTEMLSETKIKLEKYRNTVLKGEFDIVLQPIVELQTELVHHYEALSRIHALGPDASPYQFITFAEEVGVIAEFDLAVCRKAIDQLLHADQHSGELSIAVNLSGRSLQSDNFVDELMALLMTCGEIRHQLMFEVTESSQIKNLARTNGVLKKLRQMGHAVCLDDFGAGAAGYQYLRELSIDYVKIDGVYVREAVESANGRAFLKSMATLCNDLKIATIGECVETVEQAELLKELGVPFAQGYLFGKPEPRVSGSCEPFIMRKDVG